MLKKTSFLKDYFYLDEIIDILTLYLLVLGKFRDYRYLRKSLFFRVAEVCFCLFFKEKMVWIWSVFFKIRSVVIIGHFSPPLLLPNSLVIINWCTVYTRYSLPVHQ